MTVYESNALYYPEDSKIFTVYIIISIGIIIVGINYELIILMILGAVSLIASIVLKKPSQKDLNQLKTHLELEKFMIEEIFILNDFIPSIHNSIEVVNGEGSTTRGVMFMIYLQSKFVNADAIIINDSNITTHTHTNVSSNRDSISVSTINEDKVYIMATLVKYINLKDKPLNLSQQSMRDSIFKSFQKVSHKLPEKINKLFINPKEINNVYDYNNLIKFNDKLYENEK